ncbi:PH domain-containing protein [Candidatus Villigracilis saccharophilus]|uniref:PH domain-containing protein n=1 Tax=Candidatus Villigracilis saccharophilus TaxID=3140684 RepID=UPI003136EC20|nr:PH domain-containing protein [Anaerolineales bacterium]
MAKTYIENMLGENERIILVTRQHGFVLFSSIIAEIVVTLIVIAAFIVMTLSNPLAAFGFLLALIPLGIMTWDIFTWNNHQYVVTNRRVIQISGIFNKAVIDSSLEKVTDIKMTQSFFGRLFDYGDVEILTASEIGVNLFKRIGNPIKFKTAMLNAKEKLGYEGTGAHAQRSVSIPALIDALEELRKKGILTEEEFKAKKKELLAKM